MCEFDVPAEARRPRSPSGSASLAVRAFRALDCQGLARVDFFVDRRRPGAINEINTMPGFTPISMYPKMWEVTGIGYRELVDTLVGTALATRHRSSLTRTGAALVGAPVSTTRLWA